MKWRWPLIVAFACGACQNAQGVDMEFVGQTQIRFANVEEGRAALAQRDAFVESVERRPTLAIQVIRVLAGRPAVPAG